MPVFGPFESRIVVNEHALPEYEEREETDATGLKMITCWIPSEVDQEFAIRLRDNRMLGRPATRWRTTVDGVVLGSKPIFSDTGPFSSTRNERHRKDIPTDKGRRKIRFSELKLTDDDGLLHMTGNAALGEMRVRVTPVKVDGPLPRRCDRVVTLGGDTVHERSKKAGAHHVQLGATSKHADGPGYRTSPTGPPIVEFVFRYRPIDLLRANGIAPQVAQSTPTGHAHSSEIPTEVDPEAVKNERIRRLEEELLHLRGEGSASGTVIKTEAGRCSLTKLASGSDDIIDLTLDD